MTDFHRDMACRECFPQATSGIVRGFRCQVHQATALHQIAEIADFPNDPYSQSALPDLMGRLEAIYQLAQEIQEPAREPIRAKRDWWPDAVLAVRDE